MFSVNFRPEKLELPHKMVKEAKADWQAWEAGLLVETALSNHIIEAYIPQFGYKIQTFVHAFDLQQSEILLDGLYPNPFQHQNNSLEYDTCEIWLQVKTQDTLYLLLTELKEIDGHLVTVKVIDAGMTRNRRWEDRIYFPRLSAPKVELQLADCYLPNAQLSNLSVGGAQIILFSTLPKNEIRKQNNLLCVIKFNQDLNFSINAVILQRQFSKSPCLHCTLRVKFTHRSSQERARLSSLIFAFQSDNFQRVA